MMILKPTHNWKLYQNPFYKSHLHQEEEENKLRIHRLYLPISSKKIALVKQLMEADLKAELKRERKAREKLENANKRMAKELNAERKGRVVLERVCEILSKENESVKANYNKMAREIEDERKMMRVADILREERVQMKMKEAKILMEEKFAEMEKPRVSETDDVSEKRRRCVVENPHIKRGIKGFVEFPRVVKAIGSKSRVLGTKLEFQKAQLMILLKNKSLNRSNNMILS